ncbi:MAG: RNA polymerase sigma factor [Dehalococcoidia bacterium]
MRSTDDAAGDILAGLRARDPRALEALYDQYGRRAFGLAYRVLGSGEAAEDAVQEAFIALWNQVDRLDGARGQVGSLLMTIVHRRSIDLLRRQRGLAARSFAPDFDVADPAAADVLAAVADSMTLDAVRAALAALPAEQQRIIGLAYFEGMTQTEIAEREGLPVGTVKSRLRLGLTRLRSELGVGHSA